MNDSKWGPQWCSSCRDVQSIKITFCCIGLNVPAWPNIFISNLVCFIFSLVVVMVVMVVVEGGVGGGGSGGCCDGGLKTYYMMQVICH